MPEKSIDRLVSLVRSEIRGERPYLVPGEYELPAKLNQNESPYDLPEDLKRDILETFFRIPFNRYPREQPFELVDTISRFHGITSDAVLVGNGSNDLTQTLGLSFVSTGTQVVLPRPMFALFESIVRMHAGVVIGVPPLSDLRFDTDSILQILKEDDPELTIVASPNNPTGLAVPFSELESICSTANGIVVIDEAYQEFSEETSAVTLLGAYPNLLLMRTLSKAYGLAGLRIGYLLGHPALIREIMKARLPFMVDRMAEHVAITILRNRRLLEPRIVEIRRATRALTKSLMEMDGVKVIPSQTNFVLFRTGLPADVMAAHLAVQGVLVRNMNGYPELTGYLRVSAGTPSENKAFLDALEIALDEAPKNGSPRADSPE